MKARNAELLLAGVVIARATSLLFNALSLKSLGAFNLLGLRFSLAFLVLLALFFRRLRGLTRKTLLGGMALGACFFAVMTAELFGLKRTDSSTTSFLENTAIVWVPLFQALLLRRGLDRKAALSAVIALTGVGLLTLGRKGLHLGGGELLCLLASVLYAAAILLTDRLSRKNDPLQLGIVQVGTLGVLGLLFSFLFETPRLPASGAEWGMILMLALVCSCFGFTLQPVAQRYVSAERAGSFCALNPLTAALLGAVFLGERLGPWGLAGAVLILSGILIQSLPERKKTVEPMKIECQEL